MQDVTSKLLSTAYDFINLNSKCDNLQLITSSLDMERFKPFTA